MLHIESKDKIYFTREYDQFRMLKGNRALNEKKIAKIIKDIESGFDMLPFCPVVVDEQMNIIDGQHRFEIAKRLQSNVFYVICQATTLSEVAKLNSRTERWKTEDFINCYIEQGIEDYAVLKGFLKKYEIPKFTTLTLLYKNAIADGNHSALADAFEAGLFRVKYLEEATEFAVFAYKFKAFKNFLSTPFLIALWQLKKANKCDFASLVEIFQTYHSPLESCRTAKDYKLALENIYNYKKSIRRIIF